MKIIVQNDQGDEIDVTEAVRVLYDSMYEWMGLASGFLDHEESIAINGLAAVAGFKDFAAAQEEVQEARMRQEREQAERDRHAAAARRRHEEAERTRLSWQDPTGQPIFHGLVIGE